MSIVNFRQHPAFHAEGLFEDLAEGRLSRSQDSFGNKVRERNITAGVLVAIGLGLDETLGRFPEYGVFIQCDGYEPGEDGKLRRMAIVSYLYTVGQLRALRVEGKVINAEELDAQLEGLDDDVAFIAPSHTESVDAGAYVKAAVTRDELKHIMKIDAERFLEVSEGEIFDQADDYRPRVYRIRSEGDAGF